MLYVLWKEHTVLSNRQACHLEAVAQKVQIVLDVNGTSFATPESCMNETVDSQYLVHDVDLQLPAQACLIML